MKKLMITIAALLLLTGCNAPGLAGTSTSDSGQSSREPTVIVGGDVEEDTSAQQPVLQPEEPAVPLAEQPDASASSGTDASSSSTATVSSSQSESSGEERPVTLKLVVPEGYTLARIGMTLEDMGVCTSEEFIQAAQTADYSNYPLVAAIPASQKRCYLLEGYLFPATYDIYSNESPESIIRRMLEHTESRFTADLRQQVQASGYTVDEILAIASIIEKESFGQQNMPGVSGVLHNRLDTGMRLECDVTITYVEGAIKPFITGDVNRYNDHYNTYKCAALPASAICNPGMAAIRAALAPEDHPYFFFVTDDEQNYHYAETFEQHKENIAAIGLHAER